MNKLNYLNFRAELIIVIKKALVYNGPLDLQNVSKSKTNTIRDNFDRSRSKMMTSRTTSPTSSSGCSASRVQTSRGQCVMFPSSVPSLDLMTALATIKAEFIQNYIMAMINRKVRYIESVKFE